MPRLTVVVPVYKVEAYLRQCMDSVVNQTLTDLEILCVFTHSADASEAILEEYAAQDSRIRLINRDDGGLAEARNVGMRVATGDYIAFLDSDDYCEPTACERAYAAARDADADLVMFYFDCFGDLDKKPPPRPISEITIATGPLEKVRIQCTNWHTAWSNLYRTSFLQRHGQFFHYGLIFEDLPFVLRASLLANRLVVLPEVLVHYRQRSASQMQQEHYFLQRIVSFNHMLEDVAALRPPAEVGQWLLAKKYNTLYYTSRHLDSTADAYRRALSDDLSDDVFQAIRTGELEVVDEARLFYLSLKGSRAEYLAENLRYRCAHAPQLLKRWLRKSVMRRSRALQ